MVLHYRRPRREAMKFLEVCVPALDGACSYGGRYAGGHDLNLDFGPYGPVETYIKRFGRSSVKLRPVQNELPTSQS